MQRRFLVLEDTQIVLVIVACKSGVDLHDGAAFGLQPSIFLRRESVVIAMLLPPRN
jgi:hypothetical protein